MSVQLLDRGMWRHLHGKQFHPVIDQSIAEALRNLALQCFKFRIYELDDLPRLDINQVIVMRIGSWFVT